MTDFTLAVEFTKRLEDKRLVAGYAYVSKMNGKLLRDLQGDSVEVDVLRDAVHEFMKTGRALGVMHIPGPDGKPVAGGEIVEMAVFGGDIRPPGMDPGIDALWIVAKVQDDMVWSLVKSGDLRGFSIGGAGKLEEVP